MTVELRAAATVPGVLMAAEIAEQPTVLDRVLTESPPEVRDVVARIHAASSTLR